jgi:anaerobic ribonucleoside-triphosphate reductase activating protein
MRYAQVIYDDSNNGLGLRISFWVQGCTHRCKGCHNQSLWEFDKGEEFNATVIDDVLKHFKKHEDYYEGLSILGGEPFDNLDVSSFITQYFKNHFPSKNIWIWSGYKYEELINDKDKLELLKLCDVLIDGEFVEELKDLNLKYRGSLNQRVIDIQKSLKDNQLVLL